MPRGAADLRAGVRVVAYASLVASPRNSAAINANALNIAATALAARLSGPVNGKSASKPAGRQRITGRLAIGLTPRRYLDVLEPLGRHVALLVLSIVRQQRSGIDASMVSLINAPNDSPFCRQAASENTARPRGLGNETLF
jgi:hypothetical protein